MYKYTTCFWILNFVFQCVYFYWLCEINKGVIIKIGTAGSESRASQTISKKERRGWTKLRHRKPGVAYTRTCHWKGFVYVHVASVTPSKGDGVQSEQERVYGWTQPALLLTYNRYSMYVSLWGALNRSRHELYERWICNSEAYRAPGPGTRAPEHGLQRCSY